MKLPFVFERRIKENPKVCVAVVFYIEFEKVVDEKDKLEEVCSTSPSLIKGRNHSFQNRRF